MRRLLFTRQRGVALIMAVLIVALATILAISVASEGYMDQRRTSTVMIMDQAYEIALGGEALAAYALVNDNKPQIDSADEAWATPIAFPLDDGIGDIKGNLEDLQGRFNLNNLVDKQYNRNQTMVVQFQTLLKLLDIDPKFATLTLDWIDADNVPDPLAGAEDSTYAGLSPPYLAPNMPITRTSELMSVLGMKQEDYLRLEPFIAALPVGTPLNVCTAAPVVLDSLNVTLRVYSTDANVFAQTRKTGGCYPSQRDILNAFSQDTDFGNLIRANPQYLGQTTSYFRANILVTIGTTEFALYSVLNRLGTGPNGKTNVIQRSFGTT